MYKEGKIENDISVNKKGIQADRIDMQSSAWCYLRSCQQYERQAYHTEAFC